MKIEDIKHLLNEGQEIEEGQFARTLEQHEELPQLLLDYNNSGNYDWEDYEKFIQDYNISVHKEQHKYRLDYISKSGEKITGFGVTEWAYKGYRFVIEYKGFEYLMNILKHGDIYGVWFIYKSFKSPSNSIPIHNIDSMETIHNKSIEIIKQDKREVMNYYNKKIKDIKQEYRHQLNKRKSLLERG
jgi:hypothetical protein